MISIFDQSAWLVVRMLFLFQATLMSWAYRLSKPQNLGDQMHQIGQVMGNYMIAYTKSPEELPRIVTEKLLPVGRIVIAMLTITVLLKMISLLRMVRG